MPQRKRRKDHRLPRDGGDEPPDEREGLIDVSDVDEDDELDDMLIDPDRNLGDVDEDDGEGDEMSDEELHSHPWL